MPDLAVTDQMGNSVRYLGPPKSIISLVPSQTELLFDLGLEKQIRGVTKFCVHPAEKTKDIIKIGGTKNFRFDVIDTLCPDLIIGNKEENYQEGINALKAKYPVWMSDISNLAEAKNMIAQVSALVGRAQEGENIIAEIDKSFESLKPRIPKKVLYFIWKKPFMVAGKHTFIDYMLQAMGLKNAVEQERYPVLNPGEIRSISPDLILLSSEPYPFKASHFGELQEICPQAAIRIVDGEMFSWYGSRLKKAPAYLNSLVI